MLTKLSLFSNWVVVLASLISPRNDYPGVTVTRSFPTFLTSFLFFFFLVFNSDLSNVLKAAFPASARISNRWRLFLFRLFFPRCFHNDGSFDFSLSLPSHGRRRWLFFSFLAERGGSSATLLFLESE